MHTIHLGPDIYLEPKDLEPVLRGSVKVELRPQALQSIADGRAFLEDFVKQSKDPIYGINTGFGALCNVEVSADQLAQLQDNLVRSHACGMGDEVEPTLVRMMMVLKIQGLSHGYSGVRLETVMQLVNMVNADILPLVYESGSLGASGDLAPLAHIALGMMGEGKVRKGSKILDASVALENAGLQPLQLASKEGLALLNGTQFMSAYLTAGVIHGMRLSYQADMLAAYSLEAFDGRKEAFDPAVHRVRPHKGQVLTAERIMEFIAGSPRMQRKKAHVQDPYSLRCVPQVHGATKDTLDFVYQTLVTEINAVSDNPTLIPEEGKIISAGNFHGQPLALALDYLAIALAELGNISERRTYLLISGQRGLPPFLAPKAGLNSGLMISQYTAASIVSKNKQLCTPASVDSIPSSNGQEDHVSMGANAAVKLLEVVNNVEAVLAVELVTAAQAYDMDPLEGGTFIHSLHQAFRQNVPAMMEDRFLQPDLLKAQEFLREMQVEN